MKTARRGEAEPSPHISWQSHIEQSTKHEAQSTKHQAQAQIAVGHFALCAARATFYTSNVKQDSEPGSNARRA